MSLRICWFRNQQNPRLTPAALLVSTWLLEHHHGNIRLSLCITVSFLLLLLLLQYHKEVVRLMSGEFRQRIGERYIHFARKWMTYVLTKCESGRGTKPR